MVRRKTVMTAVLAFVLCAAVCIGIAPYRTARAEEPMTVVSDWSGGTGVTVAVNADDPQKTDITLPYNQNGHAVFGSVSAPYSVASDAFKLFIDIGSLKEGQRFALSFIKDTAHMPFDGEATGISFVFECTAKKEGGGLRLRLFIVDSANGDLINEMKEEVCNSMWAYKTDAAFGEFTPTDGQEHYSYGYVGSLNPASVEGQTLQFVNMIDGASYGGTTNRPGITTGASLGTTVPGIAYTGRGLAKDNVIMVLSAVPGEDPTVTSDLRFTVNVPEDKKTTEYTRAAAPVKTAVRNCRENAAKAAAGTLSAEDYEMLKAAYEALDLSVLRPRDLYLQQDSLTAIDADLQTVTEKATEAAAAVTAYQTALTALDSLTAVTEENTETALAAKEALDALTPFVKYAENRTQLEEAMAALPVKNLTRAQTELQVRVFEAAVDAFADGVTAQKIFAAETARAAINETALAELDSTDKDALTARIAAGDAAVASAREDNAQAVEELKIQTWQAAIDALDAQSNLTAYEDVAAARPTLNMQGIDADGQAALQAALASADTAFETALNAELGRWLEAYVAETDKLLLDTLTQDKIDAAQAAAYDPEYLAAMQRIAGGGPSYDIADAVAALTECDRLVAAAEAQLPAVLFYSAANGELASAAQIDAAYRLHAQAAESDLSMLTQDEQTAYDTLLQDAETAYEQKTKTAIDTAVTAFAAAADAENLHTAAVMRAAKDARAAVPSISYLLTESDRSELQARYDAANAKLLARPIYYAESGGPSWTVSETAQGVRLDNKLNQSNGCEGLALIEGAYAISTLDFAFDFTKIGKIYKGIENEGTPEQKNARAIYVLNIKNAPGKNKDEAMGFTVFFVPNHNNELEVEVYLPNGDSSIASGKVMHMPITADPYEPFTVRVRVSRNATGYALSVNTLSLNLSYRQFINPASDKTAHMPEFEAGAEIGKDMFRNDKAYLNFVVFAESLTEEERSSAITIRMIGDKTFGDYTPPVLTESVELVSGPAKTTYAKGEQFDKTGIVMRATLSDGTVKDIPLDDIKVLGFASTSRGEKSVTLSYTDENGDTFNKVIKVTIVDAAESGEPEEKGCGCSGAVSATGTAAAIGVLLAAAVLLSRKKFGKSEK